jgi:cobalt-zinc-cadmium efflux system membrane fusion protein
MDNRFVLQSPVSRTATEREINPGMEVRSDVAPPLFVISDLSHGKTSDPVYVNMGNHHSQKRPVKVGPRLKDRAVIHEGLTPGERVVIEGALLLRAEQGSDPQKRQNKQ